MERSESIGELLVSRLPRPENLAAYQEEVSSLLAANEKKLRRVKKTIVWMWTFVIVVSIPSLWMAGQEFGTPQGNWFLGWTCVWVLLGAIEVAKYDHNQARVELLKELKQLQLQVLELQSSLTKPGNPASDKL